MRIRILCLTLALAVTASACSRNVEADSEPRPAAAATLDPSGLYDFTATFGDETRTGTLQINRNAAGEYSGEAWLEGEPDPAIIDNAVIAGNHVVLNAWVGGTNAIRFELDFAGSAFSGTIHAGDQAVAVTGTRRAQ